MKWVSPGLLRKAALASVGLGSGRGSGTAGSGSAGSGTCWAGICIGYSTSRLDSSRPISIFTTDGDFPGSAALVITNSDEADLAAGVSSIGVSNPCVSFFGVSNPRVSFFGVSNPRVSFLGVSNPRKSVSEVSFPGTSFSGASMPGLFFHGVSFTGISFHVASFVRSGFPGVSFTGDSARGVFFNADFIDVSFIGACLAGVTRGSPGCTVLPALLGGGGGGGGPTDGGGSSSWYIWISTAFPVGLWVMSRLSGGMGVGSLSSLSRSAAGSPRATQGLQGLQGATVARVEVGGEREGPGAAARAGGMGVGSLSSRAYTGSRPAELLAADGVEEEEEEGEEDTEVGDVPLQEVTLLEALLPEVTLMGDRVPEVTQLGPLLSEATATVALLSEAGPRGGGWSRQTHARPCPNALRQKPHGWPVSGDRESRVATITSGLESSRLLEATVLMAIHDGSLSSPAGLATLSPPSSPGLPPGLPPR